MEQRRILLKVLSGRAEKSKYLLEKPSILIGTAEACDVRVKSPDVSPIHVLLQRSGETYVMVRRGVLPVQVNGKETDQAVLGNNDELTVAGLAFSLEMSGGSPDPRNEGGAAGNAAAAKKKKTKIYLFLAAYLSWMALLLMLYLNMGQGKDPIASTQQRLDALELSFQGSTLPNKQEIRDQLHEALRLEFRLPRATTIAKIRGVLDATLANPDTNPFGKGFLSADPEKSSDTLRTFILEENSRQNRLADLE